MLNGTAQYLPFIFAVFSVDGMNSFWRAWMCRRHVLEPALRSELRGPDHVHAEHVAFGRLRLQALGELRALLVGRRRQLEQLHVHVGVGLVVELRPG